MPRAFLMQYKKQKRVKIIYHENNETQVTSVGGEVDEHADPTQQMDESGQSDVDGEREKDLTREAETRMKRPRCDRSSDDSMSSDENAASFKSSKNSAFRKIAETVRNDRPGPRDSDSSNDEIQECDSTTHKGLDAREMPKTSSNSFISTRLNIGSSRNPIDSLPQATYGLNSPSDKYFSLSNYSIFGLHRPPVRNLPSVPNITPYPDPRISFTHYYLNLSRSQPSLCDMARPHPGLAEIPRAHPLLASPMYQRPERREGSTEDLSLSPGDEHRGHAHEHTEHIHSKAFLGGLHRSPVSASSTGSSPNSGYPSPASASVSSYPSPVSAASSEDVKVSPILPSSSILFRQHPYTAFSTVPISSPQDSGMCPTTPLHNLPDFMAPRTLSLGSATTGSFQAGPPVPPPCFPALIPGGTRQRDPNKPPPVKKYKCDVCGKAFSRSNTLVTHKRIHTGDKPFKCDVCGRAFRQPGNLTRHKLTHTTLKPYVCRTCNKAFNRASNLHTHMRTHTNYKPFVCQFCGKGFHQKIDMKIHSYTHTGEKPHKCKVCGRGFKQLTHLTYHLRTHSEIRMYHCHVCGKGFNQKGNLQAHVYGHTGERPYKCGVCGKGFTLASTLNTHRRTHEEKRPHVCGHCGKDFHHRSALRTHLLSSHPIPADTSTSVCHG